MDIRDILCYGSIAFTCVMTLAMVMWFLVSVVKLGRDEERE